ncbi:MICOS complex subunit MIC26-like [Branchiostoma lanceolatum]|uniref:MICOS complex subunit MIC26-like n=1 Tax=Branchiostoma lanceolatum TaxID=7740 RepID=UPI0034547039
MAAKFPRLLPLAVLPASASLGAVYASEVVKKEETDCGCGKKKKKKTVSISELPIYDQPPDLTQYTYIEEDDSFLRQHVSKVRQAVWKGYDKMEGTRVYVVDKYRIAEKKTTDGLEYVQSEEGFFPRLGVITLSGLTGLVLGARGGLIKKAVYSTTLAGAAASLCYPNQAVNISRSGYTRVKDFTLDQYNSIRQGGKPKSKPSKPAPEAAEVIPSAPETPAAETPAAETPAAEDAAAVTDAPAAEPAKDKPKGEVDFGQSNPEDKDMYTTRGS